MVYKKKPQIHTCHQHSTPHHTSKRSEGALRSHTQLRCHTLHRCQIPQAWNPKMPPAVTKPWSPTSELSSYVALRIKFLAKSPKETFTQLILQSLCRRKHKFTCTASSPVDMDIRQFSSHKGVRMNFLAKSPKRILKGGGVTKFYRYSVTV